MSELNTIKDGGNREEKGEERGGGGARGISILTTTCGLQLCPHKMSVLVKCHVL